MTVKYFVLFFIAAISLLSCQTDSNKNLESKSTIETGIVYDTSFYALHYYILNNDTLECSQKNYKSTLYWITDGEIRTVSKSNDSLNISHSYSGLWQYVNDSTMYGIFSFQHSDNQITIIDNNLVSYMSLVDNGDSIYRYNEKDHLVMKRVNLSPEASRFLHKQWYGKTQPFKIKTPTHLNLSLFN